MIDDRVLLFVGAHPDDESFGPGATLAHYALSGVKVYVACATRGEAGTIDPQFFMSGLVTTGDVRWGELQCAGKALGLAGIFHLGYRDSGMAGSPDNKHSEALCNAPIDEAAGRIVKIIREIKPQVILTHDQLGDYGHPDHIATNKAASAAFYAAGDPKKYPEAGLPFQPSKLYYNVFPRRMIKFAVKLLPLFGQNPKKFGRNKDIDLTSLAGDIMPVNAIIKLERAALKAKDAASACHQSQLAGGGGPPRRGIISLLGKLFGRRDSFTRAYPTAESVKESDLFEGIV
jgi:N-acetyl-1-D-myo-inositol-2-amino-2-deoxy-alpha-D-glucopyranoside deacetylase/mycothiol S-conjugate amidase